MQTLTRRSFESLTPWQAFCLVRDHCDAEELGVASPLDEMAERDICDCAAYRDEECRRLIRLLNRCGNLREVAISAALKYCHLLAGPLVVAEAVLVWRSFRTVVEKMGQVGDDILEWFPRSIIVSIMPLTFPYLRGLHHGVSRLELMDHYDDFVSNISPESFLAPPDFSERLIPHSKTIAIQAAGQLALARRCVRAFSAAARVTGSRALERWPGHIARLLEGETWFAVDGLPQKAESADFALRFACKQGWAKNYDSDDFSPFMPDGELFAPAECDVPNELAELESAMKGFGWEGLGTRSPGK